MRLSSELEIIILSSPHVFDDEMSNKAIILLSRRDFSGLLRPKGIGLVKSFQALMTDKNRRAQDRFEGDGSQGVR